MEFEDKILTCMECQKKFIFTKGEQEFYASRGFDNIPTRCKECRDRRRKEKLVLLKKAFEILCARCGSKALVPFKPKDGVPTYCPECYRKMKYPDRI